MMPSVTTTLAVINTLIKSVEKHVKADATVINLEKYMKEVTAVKHRVDVLKKSGKLPTGTLFIKRFA